MIDEYNGTVGILTDSYGYKDRSLMGETLY